ncbi:hypothetical protein HYPSUDRAFT_208367 [Hypholoma sublateritium FD-334 SS-4]|uniref:Uncharacterized protein n=1 Tax=Hypholoma sublateritium (strain FD-334 SS-4) TaxID=945553 RepID=A0A0D2LVH8_HYPSF|nr:hypothetical protein HYPSUDRAFT_208367 [Hypholoma sublateritium FD-334 SS-4]
MLSHFPEHQTAAFAPRDAPGHPLSAASITGITMPPEDEDNGAHLAAFVGMSPIHESPSARTSSGACAGAFFARSLCRMTPGHMRDHRRPCITAARLQSIQHRQWACALRESASSGTRSARCTCAGRTPRHLGQAITRASSLRRRTDMNTDANDAPSLAVAAAASSYRFYDSGTAWIGGTCNSLHVPLHVLRRPCLLTTTAMLACQRSRPHVLLDLGAHRRRPSTSAQ